MSDQMKLMPLAIMLAISARAEAAGWQLQPANGSRGVILTFGSDAPVRYRFECKTDEVLVTETGVTKLIALKNGHPIGDGPDAVMPPNAAMMALFSGKGSPQFVPAEAMKNTAGGWNLTIRLPKNDEQMKAVGTSKTMSLFTTGYTMAVAMDGAARAKWKDFMRRCNSVH